MHDLVMHVRSLSYRHRGDKSDRTLARERGEASQFARILVAGGYKHVRQVSDLKGKHFQYVLDVWQGRRPNPLTGKTRALKRSVQKTYFSTARAIARWSGKPSLMPKKNSRAGVPPPEKDAPVVNTAWRISSYPPDAIRDLNVRLVAYGQEAFGLRFQEAALCEGEKNVLVVEPDHEVYVSGKRVPPGEYLRVDRGAKTGRERVVSILNDRQRRWIADVTEACKGTPQGTLVSTKSLRQFRNLYRSEFRRAGLSHGHGLREGYAQTRYRQLTGWYSPKEGGPSVKDMNAEDRAKCIRHRTTLSEELGHWRWEVTSIYVGK